ILAGPFALSPTDDSGPQCLADRGTRQAVARNSKVAVAAWAGQGKTFRRERARRRVVLAGNGSFTSARAPARSLGADHHFADLDHRGDVRIVRYIAHDLFTVLAHPGLERLERVDIDVAHADIGRRCARSAARKTLVHRIELAGLAKAVLDQRHVLVAVIGVIEARAFLVRIHDADLEHGVLPAATSCSCDVFMASPVVLRPSPDFASGSSLPQRRTGLCQ